MASVIKLHLKNNFNETAFRKCSEDIVMYTRQLLEMPDIELILNGKEIIQKINSLFIRIINSLQKYNLKSDAIKFCILIVGTLEIFINCRHLSNKEKCFLLKKLNDQYKKFKSKLNCN